MIPGVAVFAASYFCVKSSSYGMLFWLPLYLDSNGLNPWSSSISSMFSYGTFLGGIITGFISDHFNKRTVILSPFLLSASFLMLVVFIFLAESPVPYYFVIFFIGILLGGPYNIISSSCAIDLAK